MSNLRRMPYTKPVPAGAEIVTRKGERFARFKSRGKTVEAPLTEDGTRIRLFSRKWYGEYVDAGGVERCVPLATDKTAAEQMLAALVRKAELGKAGVVDPFEQHRKRPLLEHLADFEADLQARGNAPDYVRSVASRLKALFKGCGFVFIADLSASRTTDWLAAQRRQAPPRAPLDPSKEWYTPREAGAVLGIKPSSVACAVRRLRLEATGHTNQRRYPRATVEALQDRLASGMSVETTNQYLSHLKSFCRWLVKDRRMGEGDNPVSHLERGNSSTDRRHDRRELEADELRRVLAAARDSGRTFRGLTGRDRYVLYATACGTGFRASALASLTPESFDLDAEPPTVTLAARRNKSRKLKVQPLPPDVADLLRDYLRDRPAGRRVWGETSWAKDAAQILRIDLDAAGIPYQVEGPDGPLFADFHALRHTYLTLGGRAGIDLRTLQELAGHSTPVLTARYSHRRLYDLAGAVEKLPSFLPDRPAGEALRATGTEGESLRPACAEGEGRGERLRIADTGHGEAVGMGACHNPLTSQGAEAGRERGRAAEGRAAGTPESSDAEIDKLFVARK